MPAITFSASAFFCARPLVGIKRLLRIGQLSAGFVLRTSWDKFRGTEDEMTETRSRQLLEVVTKLGPTFIKVGQALSIRTDLLPAPYVAGLVKHLITATAAANETVVEAALDAVLRLSKQSPALKASLGEAGVPAALVAACAALQDEPSVCEVALSCIASLATDSPANQAAFGDGDSAAALGELLVACMEAHGADEPTVQEWGCLAAEASADRAVEGDCTRLPGTDADADKGRELHVGEGREGCRVRKSNHSFSTATVKFHDALYTPCSIATLRDVQSARVHIVLPQRELFQRNERPPTASILLNMRGSTRLDREQVQAVSHLVASAVPGLDPNSISILDNRGTLLSRGGTPGKDKTVENGMELQQAYETRLAQRIAS